MRGFYVISLVVTLPVVLQAQRVEEGVYVMSQGAVEVTRESYRFDGTMLADTVDFPLRGLRLESVAEFDAEYSPVSYTLDLYRGGGDEPAQVVNVSFADTAAAWSTSSELGDSSGVTPLQGPYAFMQNLVFGHLAVALLKYDHDVGGPQSLNVWIPEQSEVMEMTIDFNSDTQGTVEIAGTVMNVQIDENGWLRSAAVPAQNVIVESLDPEPSGT